MWAKLNQWDYLIMTASNEAHAREPQLKVRQDWGLLSNVYDIMVVADSGGRRTRGGGSTIHYLMKVLSKELEHDLNS